MGMFNKKKEKKTREPIIEEIEEDETDEDDIDEDEEVEDEEVLDDEEEVEEEEPVKQKKPLIKKSVKPSKPVAKIIDGALMDGGWIRYTILANKSMGEIGEEFPIE